MKEKVRIYVPNQGAWYESAEGVFSDTIDEIRRKIEADILDVSQKGGLVGNIRAFHFSSDDGEYELDFVKDRIQIRDMNGQDPEREHRQERARRSDVLHEKIHGTFDKNLKILDEIGKKEECLEKLWEVVISNTKAGEIAQYVLGLWSPKDLGLLDFYMSEELIQELRSVGSKSVKEYVALVSQKLGPEAVNLVKEHLIDEINSVAHEEGKLEIVTLFNRTIREAEGDNRDDYLPVPFNES